MTMRNRVFRALGTAIAAALALVFFVFCGGTASAQETEDPVPVVVQAEPDPQPTPSPGVVITAEILPRFIYILTPTVVTPTYRLEIFNGSAEVVDYMLDQDIFDYRYEPVIVLEEGVDVEIVCNSIGTYDCEIREEGIIIPPNSRIVIEFTMRIQVVDPFVISYRSRTFLWEALRGNYRPVYAFSPQFGVTPYVVRLPYISR